jgi:hypothetical protein
MFARTAVLIACTLLAACEDKLAASPPSPSSTASAAARPAPSATPSPAAPASATPVPACDVVIVPGEKIGDKPLAGTTSVQIDVDPTKSYCVFGKKLTRDTTLADMESALPKTCSKAVLIGATHVNCDDVGVALTFAGPPGIFSRVTVYPKGSPPDAGKR